MIYRLPEQFEEGAPQALSRVPMVVSCSEQVLAVRNSIIDYMQYPHEGTSRLLVLLSGKYRHQVLLFFRHMFDSSAENIILTIKSHLLKPLSLQEYAKICRLSLSAFKREFARLYDTPPKKWINDEKLKHAAYLLQHTNKNVNEIADECGFEHVSYFIKQYKTMYGITPKNTQRTKTVIFLNVLCYLFTPFCC